MNPPVDIARCRRPATRRGRRAFTLIELLAVVVIIVLLAATFVPYALSLRENGRRVRCVDNLRGIYIAMTSYARTNNFAYPRTRFDPALGGRWTAFTGEDEPNPFAANSAVQANDVSASLWLLVREQLAQPSRFVCPSSDGTPDPLLDASGAPTVGRQRGNFRGRENLTYSVASPFSAVREYALTDTLPSSFVLVADQAPSAESLQSSEIPPFNASARRLAQVNSVNHRRAGQNVLDASGSVTFEPSPYCGVGRTRRELEPGRWVNNLDGDNIYTALAPSPLINSSPNHAGPGFAGTGVGPAYRYDTFLVPGAGFEPAVPSPPKPPLMAAQAATVAVPATPADGAPRTTRPAGDDGATTTAPAATAPARTVPATAAATQPTPVAPSPATRPATTPATTQPQ